MVAYSIKDVEVLTGIKAHTLRIWEKRYGFTNPGRTDTNIRTYTDEEVRRLLRVATLYHQGYKVSKIAALTETQITEQVLSLCASPSAKDAAIEGLILAMMDMDEERFEQLFNSCILKSGFEDTIIYVIYPFMERIGVLWVVGTIHPAQEHFVSNIVRQKLIVAIDSQPAPKQKDSAFLLFLREGELHELGLLFFYYLIKKSGFKVIYLGQSVPFGDLIKVIDRHRPRYILTAFVMAMEEADFATYLQDLQKEAGDANLLVSGAYAAEHESLMPRQWHLFKTAQEFKSYLTQLKSF